MQKPGLRPTPSPTLPLQRATEPLPAGAAPAAEPARAALAPDQFTRDTGTSQRAQVLESARRILTERRLDPQADQSVPTRRVARDAQDANSWLWGRNKADAKRLIDQARPLVAERLATFTPAQRAQYEAVARVVGQVAPGATLALQTLVLADPPRLPGARPNHDGQDLLGALHALSQPGTRLAAGIDRHELVRHLVREVAEPSAINQRSRGTCATTSLQMIVAMKDPAEFVRLVAGLASPKGAVTLRNGETLERVWGTEKPLPLKDTYDGKTYDIPDERSISTRLFSAAFMDYANGENTYDNATDKHVDIQEGGLADFEVQTAVAGALGIPIDTVYAPKEAPFTAKDPVFDRLRAATASGMPISIGMKWGAPDEDGKIHGGHEVIVTAVSHDQVHILNPWGTEETIGLEAFAERVGALHFPEGT